MLTELLSQKMHATVTWDLNSWGISLNFHLYGLKVLYALSFFVAIISVHFS